MKFSLEPTHKAELKKIVKSGMSPVIIVQRAKILLFKDDGKSGQSIAEELGINRHIDPTDEVTVTTFQNVQLINECYTSG